MVGRLLRSITRLLLGAALAAPLVTILLRHAPATAQGELDVEQVAAATVMIAALVVERQDDAAIREYQHVPLGSGVIVSADGLVLTNSHVVDLTALQNDVAMMENAQGLDLDIDDALLIYGVDGLNDIPTPRYSARVVVNQPNHDLAVLAIMGDERGLPLSRPVGEERSPVPLAPPGTIGSRAVVHIFGYPVFGRVAFADPTEETIDVVRGEVRSLVMGAGSGNVDFIRIDATVSSGSSGGAVVDDFGRLVGVVTEAQAAAAGGSVAAAIPIDRARPALEEAGWIEPTPVVPAPAPISSADAKLFASHLDTQDQSKPVIGPANLPLREVAGELSFASADVDLDTFHAHAVFGVPEPASDVPWDAGFLFGPTPETTLRFSVASTGVWQYNVGAQPIALAGPVDNLGTAPGVANDLDLVVVGRRALFGIDGVLVAAIDLPLDTGPGDVAVGSGFFPDHTLPNRVTEVRDFVVTSSAADRQTFLDLLAIEQLPSTVGPLAGQLDEVASDAAPIAAADVTVVDFGAMATFTNPENLSTAPWDAGFQFHDDGTSLNRIFLGSAGNVHVASLTEAPWVATAWSYDPTPGVSNTLQIFVQGEWTLVGVNGEFVASIRLLASPVASDVFVGTHFFNDDFVQGRSTEYSDFRVWEIETTGTPTATAGSG